MEPKLGDILVSDMRFKVILFEKRLLSMVIRNGNPAANAVTGELITIAVEFTN